MTIEFRKTFHVDRIEVLGNLQVANALSIEGFTNRRTQDIIVNNGGTVKFTANAYDVSCRQAIVSSNITAQRLLIRGVFQAGVLSIQDGRDSLKVEYPGDFQVGCMSVLINILISVLISVLISLFLVCYYC